MIEQRPGPLELFQQLRDPVIMLSLFDSNIRSGKKVLHSWQVQELLSFARERKPGEIVRKCLCANNGSGKSSYTIAPCAPWIAGHFHGGRAVVTTASGEQLSRQSLRAIRNVVDNVNEFYKDWGEVFQVREREITFLPHKGTIEAFATDEPGKAEGYHPHPYSESGEFAIFVDEAKTVHDDIFTALSRCNGLTRRYDVSSPGGQRGFFYESCNSPLWEFRRVTFLDCPHINLNEVEEARFRYGEHSPKFRSMYLAEFTSEDEQTVMAFEFVLRLFNDFYSPVPNRFGKPFAGIDLSAGGDESVFSVWQGNVHMAQEVFKEKYAPDTRKKIKFLTLVHNVEPEFCTIDDGGLGEIINDELVESGFRDFRRVRNESRPIDNTFYLNRGAENWFNFARIAHKLCFLQKDEVLKAQLGGRYYTNANGKYKLEDKRNSKVKGHKSPDRADATILAFANKWDNYLFDEPASEISKGARIVPEKLTMNEVVEIMQRQIDEGRYNPRRQLSPKGGYGTRGYAQIMAERYKRVNGGGIDLKKLLNRL